MNQKGNNTSNAYTIYKATFNPFAIIILTIDLLIRQCHEILNFILFGQKLYLGCKPVTREYLIFPKTKKFAKPFWYICIKRNTIITR